jgi:hypothetical protein
MLIKLDRQAVKDWRISAVKAGISRIWASWREHADSTLGTYGDALRDHQMSILPEMLRDAKLR